MGVCLAGSITPSEDQKQLYTQSWKFLEHWISLLQARLSLTLTRPLMCIYPPTQLPLPHLEQHHRRGSRLCGVKRSHLLSIGRR